MGKMIVVAGLAAALLGMAGCTPTANSAQQAGVTTRTVMQDTGDAWRNLFLYRPSDKRPVLPQTRYCYQAQSDVVCYDSPQPAMTSKLIGYQDGRNISWIQPGGGSLGVSGGEPTAPADAKTVQVAPNMNGPSSPATVISTAGMGTPMPVSETPQAAPFPAGESVYVK